MIQYNHHKKQYLFATNISWLDVQKQIDLEKENGTHRQSVMILTCVLTVDVSLDSCRIFTVSF